MAYLFVKTSKNGSYRGLKTTLYNTHIMGNYAYQKNMEQALKFIDNYKIVSGGTHQTITWKSAVVVLIKKRNKKKHKTDTDNAYQVNKSGKSQCFNFVNDWYTGGGLTRECPILTEKDRADLKVVSNINVVGEEDN